MRAGCRTRRFWRYPGVVPGPRERRTRTICARHISSAGVRAAVCRSFSATAGLSRNAPHAYEPATRRCVGRRNAATAARPMDVEHHSRREIARFHPAGRNPGTRSEAGRTCGRFSNHSHGNPKGQKDHRRRPRRARTERIPMKPRRKVAITGIGMVTPVGNDAPSTWTNLRAGRSGAGVIQNFNASGFSTRIGAEVKGFKPEAAIEDRKLLKFASRSHRFAFGAAEEALRDAGIRPEPNTAHRWGFTVGAGMMGVTFRELEDLHEFCAPNGDFNADG